ncbi:hypothetical protein E1171_09330 [Cytophagales bacterium RKSG123]|nr:hypothetical protein [Xanthovirga aplysinae]
MIKIRPAAHYLVCFVFRENTENLTKLALELGFYDQSHFIKTFKPFAKISPSRFDVGEFIFRNLN